MFDSEYPDLEIQLTEKDIELLTQYVGEIKKPNCYVEIGTFDGGSSLIVRRINPDIDVVTIDPDNHFKPKDKDIKFINEYSSNAALGWNGQIGVLFIDGNHDEAGRDFRAWEKFLVSGSVIMFHDYAFHSKLVIRDCDELFENNPEYQIIRKPGITEDHDPSSIYIVKKL